MVRGYVVHGNADPLVYVLIMKNMVTVTANGTSNRSVTSYTGLRFKIMLRLK